MKITKSIYKNYAWLVTFSKVIHRELVTLTPMAFTKRIKMWLGGFFSAAWFRYEFYLGKNSPKDYVSDYQENLKASRINNGNQTKYVDDKIIFPLFFRYFGPVVENYAFINEGKIIPQSEKKIDSLNSIIDLLKEGKGLVIKPADGSRGGKVNKITLDKKTGNFFWNGNLINEESLVEKIVLLNQNIVCPLIQQSKYSERFYPNTTNTIRILTMIDPDTNKAYIAHAVQRIGTKHSFPVDNFAIGGLTCNIDIENGIVQKGSYIIPTESNKTWYTKHPETDSQIEGITVPNWSKIKEGIIKLADNATFLKVIGWDIIVLDEDPGFVILEGNNAPCYKVHQLHGGFLKDERISKFMKHHQIIS